MHIATLMLIMLAAGLASQWLAWRLRLPAIVLLIATGLLLGPVSGIIELSLSHAELSELIGLGVAVILFEGGMELRLGELRRVGHGIGRLTILAPPLAWVSATLAAHWIAGLSWPVSWVLGAILVVTGPTVIQPLLRQARLNKESASLLKWEGIVNDPVGVLLAVLAFQYFTLAGHGVYQTFTGLAAAVGAAALFGGLGGWLTGLLYRRGSVPPHLKAPLLIALVLIAYWASNLVQHEAGLLTVTLMGMVFGNMDLAGRERLKHFNERITVILLSVLFIVIPSRLDIGHLELLNWRVGVFVLAVLLVVRPVVIGLATIGAPMRREDRFLLAWIAPRGIVAAATAGIFGPEMVAAGYPDAKALLPLVFLVILTTVLAHGLTLGPMSRRLELSAAEENGLLIVGASQWTHALALALKKLDIDVMVADGSYERLKPIRMDGIEVYFGEILSEHAEQELESLHLSYMLCATDNDYYNALVCQAQSFHFGCHRTFQLATHLESSQEHKRLTLQQRGYFAFDGNSDYPTLRQRLRDGWAMQTTTLTRKFNLGHFIKRAGKIGDNWLLLGAVSPKGAFRLYSHEHPFTPQAGWTLLCFSMGNENGVGPS